MCIDQSFYLKSIGSKKASPQADPSSLGPPWYVRQILVGPFFSRVYIVDSVY